jgi:bacteriocin-like protein
VTVVRGDYWPCHAGYSHVIQRGRLSMKKLTLSKETLRTLDEKELSQIVGGDQSGAHVPPQGGPNTCPNTKGPGNSCT